MSKNKVKSYPSQVYVYEQDWDEDGEPIYGVVEDIKELPEDVGGDKIALYTLSNTGYLNITYSLITKNSGR